MHEPETFIQHYLANVWTTSSPVACVWRIRICPCTEVASFFGGKSGVKLPKKYMDVEELGKLCEILKSIGLEKGNLTTTTVHCSLIE